MGEVGYDLEPYTAVPGVFGVITRCGMIRLCPGGRFIGRMRVHKIPLCAPAA